MNVISNKKKNMYQVTMIKFIQSKHKESTETILFKYK